MNSIEWSAYLVTNGMLPIHEAAERVGKVSAMNVLATNMEDDEITCAIQQTRSAVTAAHREYIRVNYPTVPAKDIAIAIGIPAATVATVASRMGVRKSEVDPAVRRIAKLEAQVKYNAKRLDKRFRGAKETA